MSMDEDATVIDSAGDDGDGSLVAGQVFDKYKVVRLLGRGGMGEVYEVEHHELKTRHALKLINTAIAERVESGERFRREAKVMAQLRHPQVVHVDDFSITNGRYWLRMELSGEGNLSENMRSSRGPLPEADVREILRQVLEGLSYAHEQGVVHRDLKPANILLEGSGAELRIKIADFGLVRLAGEQWVQSQVQLTVMQSLVQSGDETIVDGASSAQGGTSTHALLGTYAYMSPEQKRGEEVDARSDLYSVGLMAYQMLTGLESIGLERPSEVVRGLDAGWDRWILKATKANREERFANAKEMLAALPAGARKAVSVAASVLPLPKARLPLPVGKVPWYAVALSAVIAVAAIAAILAFFALDKGSPSAEETAEPAPALAQVGSPEPVTPAKEPEGVRRGQDAFEQPVEPDPPVSLRLDPAIEGARVWFGDRSDIEVGADGELVLDDVDAGEYEVIIHADGYQPIVTRVTVGEDGLDQTFPLAVIRGNLHIRTSPGTEVVAVDADGNETRLGVADRNGNLISENVLRVGDYNLLFKADNRVTAEEKATLGVGRVVQVERPLAPLHGEIRVISVPQGAQVEAKAGNWSQVGLTPLTLREVPAETEVSLTASLQGFRTERRVVSLSAAEIQTVNLGTLIAETAALPEEVATSDPVPPRAAEFVNSINLSGNLETAKVLQAIEAAGLRRNWTVHETGPSTIVLKLKHRGWDATVYFVCSPNSIEMHSDSYAEDFIRGRRRAVPEGWIRNLENDIRELIR